MAALGLVCAAQAEAQQQATFVPYRGDTPPAVSQSVVSDDSPEEIAEDAARDLKDARFYNRPGATRAQYNADWQQCRLIARGSRTPSGTVPYFYNPAYVSPLAASIGGVLGGFIAGKIIEGQQRRANRRSCLLIRGWRLVELPGAEAARITAMPEAERDAYFNTIVGAAEVKGKVTEQTRFSLAPDPKLQLDAPLTRPGVLWMGKKVDVAVPLALAPQEAAIVLGYRRAAPGTAGRGGIVSLLRYDPVNRDLIGQPRDWKKKGDLTTYSVEVKSHDKKVEYELHVLRVTPGDYVLNDFTVGNLPLVGTNCFGAPTFRVEPGAVVYLGDFSPYWKAEKSDGEKIITLAHTMHLQDARATLTSRQPQLLASMRPAAWRNRATYSCVGAAMIRWDIEGAEPLPSAAPAATN